MVGVGEDWKSFAEYAELYYLPLLNELSESGNVTAEQKRRLDFLFNDLTDIVNNAEALDDLMKK